MDDTVGTINSHNVRPADRATAFENRCVISAVFDFGETGTAVVGGVGIRLEDDVAAGDWLSVVRDGSGKVKGALTGGTAGDYSKADE